MASRRLLKEINGIKKDPPLSCSAGPIGEDLYRWQGSIIGPEDSPYAGGLFDLDIDIPSTYPFDPPKIKFITRIYHPNIDNEGRICLDILKDKWSPALDIIRTLLSISSLLTEPNPRDPLMPEIAIQYETNIEEFKTTARIFTERYAN